MSLRSLRLFVSTTVIAPALGSFAPSAWAAPPSSAATSESPVSEATPLADPPSDRAGESATDEDFEPSGFSLSALGGMTYVLNPVTESQHEGTRPYRRFYTAPMVGLRGQYTTSSGFLMAARVSPMIFTNDSTVMTAALAEFGWAIPAGPVRLEPRLHVGGLIGYQEIQLCDSSTGACETSSNVDALPTLGGGLSVLVPFADRWFAGISAESIFPLYVSSLNAAVGVEI